MRAAQTVTPERDLLRELRTRKRSISVRVGGVEVQYPAIRDHEAVRAIQAWIVVADRLHAATRAVTAALPQGDMTRMILMELAGFCKRASHRISLTVPEQKKAL